MLVRLTWTGRELAAELRVDPADHDEAMAKISALCDLAADPLAVDRHLGA